MNNLQVFLLPLLPVAFIALGTAHAATVTVTDANGNSFGDTGGFAIDFDTTTGITANWTPGLTSQPYNLDSVTVFRGADPSTGTVRVGVYTTISGGTLGGFQGVSVNSITLGGLAASDPLTFTFSGLTVTPEANPGSGSDIRYFVFQTGSTAIISLATESTRVPIRRIDAETGSFADELSAILQQPPNGLGVNAIRAPEYSATITPVPEPTSLIMLGVAGGALASRRRGHYGRQYP